MGLAPTEAQKAKAENEAEAELVLDPAQIVPTTPTPSAKRPLARYAVVAVVVTDEADSEAALRIARAPVRVILERE